MVFLLIDAGFNLPALMITQDQLDGGSQARGGSPVVTNRCTWPGSLWLVVWEEGNCVRRWAVCGSMRYSITRTCTAGSPTGCRVTRELPFGEDLLGMGELTRFEARQVVGLLLMDQRTQLCG